VEEDTNGEAEMTLAERQAEKIHIRAALLMSFTPSSPVTQLDLFAGRGKQIERVFGAVMQVGQHAILYGERGVGKTSLANLIHEMWVRVNKDEAYLIAAQVTCHTEDTFTSIWRQVKEEAEIAAEKLGFELPYDSNIFNDACMNLASERATASDIRRFLELAGKEFHIIIDEFDRLSDADAPRLMADTIKVLSDHAVEATIILVGVADSVDQLIGEHASIDRSLVQVLMPRMSIPELEEIVTNGYRHVGMQIQPPEVSLIARLAQGLPHYAHRLAQEAGLAALSEDRTHVTHVDVIVAVREAVDQTHEGITSAYGRATVSSRENLYKQVLLACSVAPVDPLGYFAPVDVRDPLSRILERPYGIPNFVRQLNALATDGKGCMLQRTGPDRKPRYRFSNPLMKPFIVLKGLDEGMLPSDFGVPAA
jgi:Cdc6-like AAA superfamily ATPase